MKIKVKVVLSFGMDWVNQMMVRLVVVDPRKNNVDVDVDAL